MGGRALGLVLQQPGTPVSRLCSVHLPADLAAAAPGLARAALERSPPGARIEGQLVAFEAQQAFDSAFRHLGLAVEPREFLSLDGPLVAAPRPPAPSATRVSSLDVADLADCARLLVEAHAGGVEARINEAFREDSAGLAYLRELVDADGCGVHEPAASSVARAGGVVGFCIATRTSEAVGHIPQIAVLPAAQGRGVGAALMTRTVNRLREAGGSRVTLSVTRSNASAAAWYARAGFQVLTTFSSYYR